jgi:hypothetical protein
VRSFSGLAVQEEEVEEKGGEGSMGKGKVCCADEGSVFLQDIGNYLPGSTSSRNLNLQQHFQSEFSLITVGGSGAVALKNNLIMSVLKGISLWKLGSFPQTIVRMKVVSSPASKGCLPTMAQCYKQGVDDQSVL